jgi:threonine/homoserine/homoserine lactone efflux protein
MFDWQTLMMFALASTLLGFAPGPDNIFVLTQSMIFGRAAGFRVIFGLCTGLIFHTSLVAFGVAAIFQTSALAFNILKYIGAAYLLFLSYKAFRASTSNIEVKGAATLTSWQLYRRGIIMNTTNPKVSIFFLAFLPQFTNAMNGSLIVQIYILGFIFMVTTFFVFGSISMVAGYAGQWLNKSGKVERILNIIAGCVFAGLAVKLIL